MTDPMPTDRSLRIAIDGYNFAMPKGTGVATYGMTLARVLQGMGHRVEGVFGLDVGQNPDTREVMFYDHLGRERQENKSQARARVRRNKLQAFRRPRLVDVPITNRVEKQAFKDRLPQFDRLWSAPYLFEAAHWHLHYFKSFLTIHMADPPDIMHWTYPIPARMAGTKNIYTLHDLVPLRMPYATMDFKHLYHRLVRQCVMEGDRICTVSEASKQDILDHFPVPEEKVFNTYQISPIPEEVLDSDPERDAQMIDGLFGLKPKSYFLFFGALDPKKNIGRIIEAYLTSHSASPLVIVGARDWGMAGEKSALGNGVQVYGHSVSGRIMQLDYMPRALLFRLIRTARAVLLPSLFEGFGLPALEAIQLGTPVIASNTSSLPEVVGKAGLLVDPYSVSDIANAIERLDRDEIIREQLVAAGPEQTAKFSEDNYRDQLMALYSSTLGH
ncbi:MAG: glycosyltransferase family 1 protein [Sphingobium sp.]